MNLFNNKVSVLSKLSMSYLIVVLIGTFLTGITANIILENSYDKQIVNYNSTVVNTLRDYISKDITNGIDRAYLKVVAQTDDNGFFVDSFYTDDMSYKVIKRAMNHMQDITVDENEWLDGIYTYFSEAGVLAGTDGLIYKRSNRSNSLPDWMNRILESGGEYVPTQPYDSAYMYEVNNHCMIVKPYPFVYGENRAKGYVVFKINEKTFSRILAQSEVLDEGEYRAIVDKDGNIVASTREQQYPAKFDKVKELYAQGENTGYIETKINSVKYVITYSAIEPYGWRLINVCPKNVFYRTSKYIHIGMLAVCIITILLGLAVSEHFKKKIYSPIRSIVERIGGIQDREVDEYGAINAAINDMSYRISDMQGMIDSAKQAAKKELVISLCRSKVFNNAEFKKLIQMCPFDTAKKVYVAVIFKLDKDITENLTAESIAQIITASIDAIEGMSDENVQYTASYYENNKILAVAGFSHANDDIIFAGIQNINEMMFTAYYLSFVSVVGMPVKRYEDIHLSFECAKNADKYTMFSKQRSLIYAPEVLKLDNSSLMMDDRVMENLRRDIYSFDLQAIKDDINFITGELSGKGYSASYCNGKLLEIVNIISAYIRDNGMNSADIMDSDLITIFNEMDNIYEYVEWIYAVIERIAEKLNTQNDTGNSQIIERVKAYINDNLSDELSLTSVSDRVYISSQYLCKIFKEETNMNFIDYVTSVRMEKAKELLVETSMNIESIAQSVGYKTPHYFTKKFKERFGMTPKNFRMNQ